MNRRGGNELVGEPEPKITDDPKEIPSRALATYHVEPLKSNKNNVWKSQSIKGFILETLYPVTNKPDDFSKILDELKSANLDKDQIQSLKKYSLIIDF